MAENKDNPKNLKEAADGSIQVNNFVSVPKGLFNDISSFFGTLLSRKSYASSIDFSYDEWEKIDNIIDELLKIIRR